MADLPTRFGWFQIAAFSSDGCDKDPVAVIRGDVAGKEAVPTRVHSACLTSEALGSLRCDCREQLEASLALIAARECGLVLYLQQEGRGIGLGNKIRAYALQDRGMDTVEANHALGFGDDERDYAVAAQMLARLRVGSIELLTNNPRKVDGLARHGVRIARRLPHVVPANRFNRRYLETKARRSGHWLEVGRDAMAAEGDVSSARWDPR